MSLNPDVNYFQRQTQNLVEMKNYNHYMHLYFYDSLQTMKRIVDDMEKSSYVFPDSLRDKEEAYREHLINMVDTLNHQVPLEDVLSSNFFFKDFIAASEIHYQYTKHIVISDDVAMDDRDNYNPHYTFLFSEISDFIKDLLRLFQDDVRVYFTKDTGNLRLNLEYLEYLSIALNPYWFYATMVDVMDHFGFRIDKVNSTILNQYYTSDNGSEIPDTLDVNIKLREACLERGIDPFTVSIWYNQESFYRTFNTYHMAFDPKKFAKILDQKFTEREFAMEEYHGYPRRIIFFLEEQEDVQYTTYQYIILKSQIDDIIAEAKSVTEKHVRSEQIKALSATNI